MTSIPVENIRQVIRILDSYEDDEAYRVDLSLLPEWPNEPARNTPEWVAMQIILAAAAAECDDMGVYEGFSGARQALEYVIDMK